MSTQYRLVQSGKTARGGCSAGQGSSEPVAPRIIIIIIIHLDRCCWFSSALKQMLIRFPSFKLLRLRSVQTYRFNFVKIIRLLRKTPNYHFTTYQSQTKPFRCSCLKLLLVTTLTPPLSLYPYHRDKRAKLWNLLIKDSLSPY
jgi:hypothetical protein